MDESRHGMEAASEAGDGLMAPIPLLQDNFQDSGAIDPDETSAPAMPQVQQPVPAVLSPKLKKPSKLKNPSALAAAIARSKRPNQRGQKWG
jgi:hypothetical protein